MNATIPSALPNPDPNIADIMHGNGTDSSGFPLTANSTVREMLTLVDALALKMYPKGFWQLTWSMTAVNLASFLLVTVALRAYRSRKNPVPFWLIRLEQRPYRVKVRSSPASSPSLGIGSSTSSRHQHWWQKLLARCRARHTIHDGEKSTETQAAEPFETRTGWFITASCVNCHLLLTSTYILILAVKVLQTYTIRHATSPPPLLDPGCLDTLMLFAIFSTAYFAAIGYIALLLPNVPPWLWNTSVVLIYVQVITIGLASLTMVALSGSKLASHRNFIHLAGAVLPSFGVELEEGKVGGGEVEEAAREVMLGIARLAWVESLKMKRWQQIAQGLVALGGFALTVIYLAVLVLVGRRVGKELVQLRSEPRPMVEERDVKVELGMRGVAEGAVAGSTILQAARVLPLRTTRTPPLTPAPKGPLPLPPVEAQISSCHPQAGMSPRTRFSLPAEAAYMKSPQMRYSTLHGSTNVSSPTRDNYGPLDSPTDSVATTRLDLGPRIRVDSELNPWDLATLHEDLATNDGYTTVCRFLFNCIIDHVAVLLQCFFFGCHSVFLLLVFTKDYPNNATQASSRVGIALMVSSTLFTVLYVINCLNLFAPFLLFPASQVRLASMLASLTLPDSGLQCTSSSRGGRRGKSSAGKASSVVVGGEDQGLKHQDSQASLVASSSKVTSEEYSGSSWRVNPYGFFSAKGGGGEGEYGRGYPPSSASLPNSPVGANGREVGGAGVGKIAAHVVAAVKNFRPSTAETDSSMAGSQSLDTVPYGTPIPSRPVPTPSALVASPNSSALTMPPFRSKRHPKASDAAARRRQDPQPFDDSTRTNPRTRLTGAQLVLESLISSHALPIQGFYCQRSIDSSSGLRLYQPNDSGESASTALSVFDEYARSASRQAKATQQQQKMKREERAFEEEEHLELSDADEFGGEGSKRRRQRLRYQFRYQVEQRRVSLLGVGGERGGERVEVKANVDGQKGVPRIVAQPPTPVGRGVAEAQRASESEARSEDQHQTVSVCR